MDPNACARAAVLDYLAHNRDAADTARGITNWWLPQSCGVDREAVERVLEALVSEGLLGVTRLADGTVIYRRPAGS